MPDSPPTPSADAVFLSYAREDVDAARRSADALRAFGVEVWLDQSELRGGDTWDEGVIDLGLPLDRPPVQMDWGKIPEMNAALDFPLRSLRSLRLVS